MSDREMKALYESILRGDGQTDKPIRQSMLYDMVNAEILEPSSEEEIEEVAFGPISIAGEAIHEDITVIVRSKESSDGWKKFRVGREIIGDVLEALEGLTDNATLITKVKERAYTANIIVDRSVSSLRDVLVNLRDFVVASATLTKKSHPDTVETIPALASKLMQEISDNNFQDDLVRFTSGKEGTSFNLWNVLKEDRNWIFDLENTSGVGHFENMRHLMPAGEAKKARGAAGPGEAILSFIYNGKKPELAGDVSMVIGGEEASIELKYNKGRIGKSILKAQVEKLPLEFITNNTEMHAHLGTLAAIPVDDAKPKVNPMYSINGEWYSFNQIAGHIANGEEWAMEFSKKAGDGFALNKSALTPYLAKWSGKIDNEGYTTAGGALKPESKILEMTLGDFMNTYSGIQEGKSGTGFNLAYPAQEWMSELISKLPGENTRHQLENLIGAIHIKSYLTHIQPFTWLVVFNDEGDARCLTHEDIVNLPVTELIDKVHQSGLRFGARTDEGGYDIQFLK